MEPIFVKVAELCAQHSDVTTVHKFKDAIANALNDSNNQQTAIKICLESLTAEQLHLAVTRDEINKLQDGFELAPAAETFLKTIWAECEGEL